MKAKVVETYKNETRENYNARLGIIFDGDDNLRPLVIENLIKSSPTASQCSWIYGSFLVGGGFKNAPQLNLSSNFWEVVTPNDLLFEIGDTLAEHQGVFIHVGYNALFEKTTYQVIPNSLCRLGKKDSDQYSGRVVISREGWMGRVKKENLEIYDAYNPRPSVIQAQVDRDGGWHNYKGQILYFKLDKKQTYARSLVEDCYIHADTENHLGLFYNSTVKRGFKDVQVLRHSEFESASDEADFERKIRNSFGAENANSLIMIEDDFSDDKGMGNMRFDVIKSDDKPDRYSHVKEAISNYIRKAYKNIPTQLVDYVSGKLGNTSGEDLIKAQSIYNATISRDRLSVQGICKELFNNYKDPINSDWEIEQYSLLKDGTAQ